MLQDRQGKRKQTWTAIVDGNQDRPVGQHGIPYKECLRIRERNGKMTFRNPCHLAFKFFHAHPEGITARLTEAVIREYANPRSVPGTIT